MRIRIACKKCGWTAEVDVHPSPIGALKPKKTLKGGIKIKWTKDQLDKIINAAGQGASREELEQLGIEISIPEWKEAQERRRLRKFVREHLRVSKEKRIAYGEKSQISTAPWQMGDSFKDIDLASSEVKSLGVDDIRLIPGVTLQKRVYETVKGQDKEILKGIKFFNIIDVSGSMFSSYRTGKIDKIHKALMMAEETYKLCKKLGYDYNLAIFSDKGTRIPKRKIKQFFKDSQERRKYPGWNGGTILTTALNLYSLKELKDGNLIIMSDMEIFDIKVAKEKLKEIASATNSFKVVIIEYKKTFSPSRLERTKELFPERKVQILKIPVIT